MYGLRLSGLPPEVDQALVPVAPDAPLVAVEVRLASGRADIDHYDGDTVVLATAGGACHEVRRQPPSATVSVPSPPSPAILAQPLMVITAAAHSRWRDALTLHGGAFASGGRAWAVVADKFGGKSTTMAGLALRGVAVLTDDLVVIDGGHVLPGPRGVDLRPETFERLGVGTLIGTMAGQRRYRLGLPPPPERVPLAGVVALEWSDGPGMKLERMAVEQRLRCLAANEALGLMGPQRPEAVFSVIDLPMYTLSRPRRWWSHDEVVDRLVTLAAG
jgi:hypothetical protein